MEELSLLMNLEGENCKVVLISKSIRTKSSSDANPNVMLGDSINFQFPRKASLVPALRGSL